MNDKIIIEVIDKLVGDYEPYGETNHDDYSNQRLKVLCEVVYHYVRKIAMLLDNKKAPQFSIQESGKIASKFFEWIDDFVEDWKEENV